MYHNPNAKHPVYPRYFSDIAHMFYDKEQTLFYGIRQPYGVLNSATMIFIPGSEEAAERKVEK